MRIGKPNKINGYYVLRRRKKNQTSENVEICLVIYFFLIRF